MAYNLIEKEFEIFLKNLKLHLKSINNKGSLQQDYILKVLYCTKEHLSASEIQEIALSKYNIKINITTIYKTLKFFKSANLISSININNQSSKYELKLSLHHDHLICTSCHKIVEFTDQDIENLQLKIAEQKDFRIDSHHLSLYGLCDTCQ